MWPCYCNVLIRKSEKNLLFKKKINVTSIHRSKLQSSYSQNGQSIPSHTPKYTIALTLWSAIKYWTWLSNCLYYQLSYKVITAHVITCVFKTKFASWRKAIEIFNLLLKTNSAVRPARLAVIFIGVPLFYWQFCGYWCLSIVHSHLNAFKVKVVIYEKKSIEHMCLMLDSTERYE